MSDTITTAAGAEFAAILAEPAGLNTSPLTKLVGDDKSKAAGEFVLQGQTLAAAEGFRNVSKTWYDKTTSYADGLRQLEEGKSQTEDIHAKIGEMVPTVAKDGRFVMFHRPTGQEFFPTPHACSQMGNWADTGTWYVEHMLSPGTDYRGRVVYNRDRGDAETLARVFSNGFRRLDQSKSFLWRTRKDGTLRAMLTTDRYLIIDNRWFLELLSKIVPDGRLSHFQMGDSDTIYGNVLIPDTIRAEKDSDYGAGLSLSNSEIGERRFDLLPWLFRAICQNGCIWGKIAGKGVNQVHRGKKFDLGAFALKVKEHINLQIPLLPLTVDKLLGLRIYGWDCDSIKPLYAQVAMDYKLSKKQATAVLEAHLVEARTTPEFAKTLFGVTAAVTRAGQKLTPAEWVKFDEIGGKLIAYSQDDFDRLTRRAKALDVKEVEDVFAMAA